MGAKLARLYPRHASLEVGSGHYTPLWLRENAQAIAGAVGLYEQGRPMRHVPALLLRLRCWPDGISKRELGQLELLTTKILARRLGPLWSDMPAQVAAKLVQLVDGGHLARMLLDELANPAPCWKCNGRGDIARGLVLMVCPICNGRCEGVRGFRARGESARMSAYQWRRYVQPVFDRTLHGFRFMADVAGRGVLDALG